MIEFKHLEIFVWIAHLGSFRAAADKLSTTQPAVSQRISQLEQALGARLFEREPRGVVPTAKGRELLPLAERMLQLRLDLVEAAREDETMRGVVRLGVSETLVHTWLAELIERLHAGHPALTLEIEVDTSPQLRERLMSRQLDLAFLLGPVDEPRIRNVPLSSYPMAWVADPRIDLGTGPVSLAALARWPIITYPRNTRPHVAVREMMVRAGVTELRMYGNASLSTIVRMTLDGIGVSAIPPVVIGRELSEGRLRLLQVEQTLPDLDFNASFPVNPDSQLSGRLVEVAVDVARLEADRRNTIPQSASPIDLT